MAKRKDLMRSTLLHGSTPKQPEPVTPIRPVHYRFSIEPIAAIESWQLGFCLGNTVKYIARAGHKDSTKTVEDLKKAAWYLQREIERLEKGRA